MQFDSLGLYSMYWLNVILSAFYSGYLGELFIDLIETRYDVYTLSYTSMTGINIGL